MVLATPRRLSCPRCLCCPSLRKGNLENQGQLSRFEMPQRQSRLMSVVEAITNVVVGYLLAIATQLALFPVFGLTVTLTENLLLGAMFSGTSLARSYVLRRLFEALRAR